MYKCKICGHESSAIQRGLSQHLSMKHHLSVLEYFSLHENFEIPKCACGKNCKHRNGITFRKTCGNSKCVGVVKGPTSDVVKDKIRSARIKYLKENPEATAWRLGNKQSWPEKFFEAACIRAGLNNRFLIVREKSVFPYYIDFAFDDFKVAVEIDGSQHKEEMRIEKDKIKDEHLTRCGWRIFRIDADKLYSESNSDMVVTTLVNFINSDQSFGKCGILSNKELRDERKNEQSENLAKQKQDALKRLTELQSDEMFITSAAEILCIRPSSVRRYLRREFPELYIKRCEKHSHRKKFEEVQVSLL